MSPQAPNNRLGSGFPLNRFVGMTLAWMPVAIVAWLALTPYYNLFLTTATQNAVRLSESPNVTSLQVYPKHHFLIQREGLKGRASGGAVDSVRVTDAHFPLIFMIAMFLAVPNVPWPKKLQNLGWAGLASVFFHLILLFFWVKFVYSTQLGAWSGQNYNAFQQNFWGLGKHLMDLCFKFALPLMLWALFYLHLLVPARQSTD